MKNLAKLCALVFLIVLAATATAEDAPVRWQIYADFDSEFTLPDGGDPTWTFRQNHASVFLSYSGGTEVAVQADLLRPDELFQLVFPLPLGTLTLGRVLLPIGLFDIHHIYGGQPDDGTFLPRLWSDWGLIYSPPTWGVVSTDFFVSNGMDPAGFDAGGTSPRISAAATDTNFAKALGLRVKAVPLTNLTLALSGSWDPASYGRLFSRALGIGAGDVAYEFDSWMVRLGYQVQHIRGTESYSRWADYVEVQWKLTWDLTAKLRAGQMDTNSLWITNEDQINLNTGLVWKTDFADFSVMYFRNFTAADPGKVGKESDYHQVLFKVLVAP